MAIPLDAFSPGQINDYQNFVDTGVLPAGFDGAGGLLLHSGQRAHGTGTRRVNNPDGSYSFVPDPGQISYIPEAYGYAPEIYSQAGFAPAAPGFKMMSYTSPPPSTMMPAQPSAPAPVYYPNWSPPTPEYLTAPGFANYAPTRSYNYTPTGGDWSGEFGSGGGGGGLTSGDFGGGGDNDVLGGLMSGASLLGGANNLSSFLTGKSLLEHAGIPNPFSNFLGGGEGLSFTDYLPSGIKDALNIYPSQSGLMTPGGGTSLLTDAQGGAMADALGGTEGYFSNPNPYPSTHIPPPPPLPLAPLVGGSVGAALINAAQPVAALPAAPLTMPALPLTDITAMQLAPHGPMPLATYNIGYEQLPTWTPAARPSLPPHIPGPESFWGESGAAFRNANNIYPSFNASAKYGTAALTDAQGAAMAEALGGGRFPPSLPRLPLGQAANVLAPALESSALTNAYLTQAIPEFAGSGVAAATAPASTIAAGGYAMPSSLMTGVGGLGATSLAAAAPAMVAGVPGMAAGGFGAGALGGAGMGAGLLGPAAFLGLAAMMMSGRKKDPTAKTRLVERLGMTAQAIMDEQDPIKKQAMLKDLYESTWGSTETAGGPGSGDSTAAMFNFGANEPDLPYGTKRVDHMTQTIGYSPEVSKWVNEQLPILNKIHENRAMAYRYVGGDEGAVPPPNPYGDFVAPIINPGDDPYIPVEHKPVFYDDAWRERMLNPTPAKILPDLGFGDVRIFTGP